MDSFKSRADLIFLLEDGRIRELTIELRRYIHPLDPRFDKVRFAVSEFISIERMSSVDNDIRTIEERSAALISELLYVINSIGEERFSYQDLNVSINIPQKKIDWSVIEQILDSLDKLMNFIGYRLKKEEKELIGSFFKDILYTLKTKRVGWKTKKELKTLQNLITGKARENAQIEDSEVEIAINELISAIECLDEIVIKIGPLLIVKSKTQTEPIFVIEFVEDTKIRRLTENSSNLKEPKKIYDLLTKQIKNLHIQKGSNKRSEYVSIRIKARELLSQGKVIDAIELCKERISNEDFLDELTIQLSKYNLLKRLKRRGAIEVEKEIVEKTKIVASILEILDHYENSVPTKVDSMPKEPQN